MTPKPENATERPAWNVERTCRGWQAYMPRRWSYIVPDPHGTGMSSMGFTATRWGARRAARRDHELMTAHQENA